MPGRGFRRLRPRLLRSPARSHGLGGWAYVWVHIMRRSLGKHNRLCIWYASGRRVCFLILPGFPLIFQGFRERERERGERAREVIRSAGDPPKKKKNNSQNTTEKQGRRRKQCQISDRLIDLTNAKPLPGPAPYLQANRLEVAAGLRTGPASSGKVRRRAVPRHAAIGPSAERAPCSYLFICF